MLFLLALRILIGQVKLATHLARVVVMLQRKENKMSKQSDLDNHANQLNENNDAYWQSRDYDERPDDWDEKADEINSK